MIVPLLCVLHTPCNVFLVYYLYWNNVIMLVHVAAVYNECTGVQNSHRYMHACIILL